MGIEEYVFTPLLREDLGERTDILKAVVQRLAVTQVKEFNTISKCIEYLSNGYPILLMDHETRGLALGLTKWEKRSIEEPSAEVGIRGPREGFTETLRINTAQIRRIIKSPHLKMETIIIGEYTQTNIVVAYIEGIAVISVVDKIKRRICNPYSQNNADRTPLYFAL